MDEIKAALSRLEVWNKGLDGIKAKRRLIDATERGRVICRSTRGMPQTQHSKMGRGETLNPKSRMLLQVDSPNAPDAAPKDGSQKKDRKRNPKAHKLDKSMSMPLGITAVLPTPLAESTGVGSVGGGGKGGGAGGKAKGSSSSAAKALASIDSSTASSTPSATASSSSGGGGAASEEIVVEEIRRIVASHTGGISLTKLVEEFDALSTALGGDGKRFPLLQSKNTASSKKRAFLETRCGLAYEGMRYHICPPPSVTSGGLPAASGGVLLTPGSFGGGVSHNTPQQQQQHHQQQQQQQQQLQQDQQAFLKQFQQQQQQPLQVQPPAQQQQQKQKAKKGKKRVCAGCSLTNFGDVDIGDGNFYCIDCWRVFEQEQQQQ